MGLDVIWRSESDENVDAFIDERDTFIDLVVDLSERDYPLLGRIDEYATTRVPAGAAFVEEVTRLRDGVDDAAAREHLSRLLALVRRAASQPRSWLELVGD